MTKGIYKKIYVGICQANLHGVNYDVIIRKTSTSPTSRSFNDPLKILGGFISFGSNFIMESFRVSHRHWRGESGCISLSH